MAIIEVKDLKKYFSLKGGMFSSILGRGNEDKLKAVDRINFNIGENEIFGLAGESGCGKTTTGMLLTNLYKPTGGEILFRGKDIINWASEDPREFRRQVQMIFQDPYEALNPRFRVFDNIAESLRALKLTEDRKEEKERVIQMMKSARLEPSEFMNRFPHQLSGGERQRVGIASALVVKPDFVVADEPVSMLDVSIRAGILDLIRSLSKEVNFASLYISHDLSVLSNISNRLAIMYLGKIIEVGTTEDVVYNPTHPYTKALISAIPIPDPTSEREAPNVKGKIPEPTNLPQGCRFRDRCPDSFQRCSKEEPELMTIDGKHQAACHLVENNSNLAQAS